MSSALYPLVPPFVAVVLLLARLLIDFGYRFGLVDQPNERSSHSAIVPRVGGISIFIPYLLLGLGLVIARFEFVQTNAPYWVGLFCIVLLGTLDDRLDLSSKLKFLVQFGVATYYVVSSGNYVDDLYGLFGVGAIPTWLGISLSVITVVYLINAVNLIDGVDGLAAGTSLLSMYLFSTLMGGAEHLFTFAFIGIGLVIFMGFNFSGKKKIFLGDAGSLGLGFILATMVMEFLHSGNGHVTSLNLNPVVVGILVLGYPIADTLRVFIIRLSMGLSPFNADRRHMHHVLLDKGFSHFGTSTFIMTCVGLIVLLNKTLAPLIDSHLMIFINLGVVLLIHLFVRYRSTQLRIFGRSFSRDLFNPVKSLWNKYVSN